ncbi:MAG: lipid-A-disaccharide synthase [bacterium]
MKIFLSAGEISGDVHGAALVEAVRSIEPSAEFAGIGGTRMRAAGVRLLHDSSAWGTVGFFEGLTRFPKLFPVLRGMGGVLKAESPDLFVPIDYRFFNMRACRAAKDSGIPVVYYFAPVSWFGTGTRKFEELARSVDLALVCLPVSLDEYERAGVNYLYVGHPMVDLVSPTMNHEEAARFFNLETGRLTIGLMPGSREHEVRSLMPVFRRAVENLSGRIPGLQFILMSAGGALTPLIRKTLRGAPVSVFESNRYDFMNVSDLLILCSGTATHEATLLGRPMIVVYRLSRLTAALVRATVELPFVSLPNILAGEAVVPELLQEKCTPAAVAAEAYRLLTDPEARHETRRRLERAGAELGAPGVIRRAAEIVAAAAAGRWGETQDAVMKALRGRRPAAKLTPGEFIA